MRLGPLRYRNFRLIWTSWTLAATASWVHQVVTNWLIFELTDSPLMLGLNGIFINQNLQVPQNPKGSTVAKSLCFAFYALLAVFLPLLPAPFFSFALRLALCA